MYDDGVRYGIVYGLELVYGCGLELVIGYGLGLLLGFRLLVC